MSGTTEWVEWILSVTDVTRYCPSTCLIPYCAGFPISSTFDCERCKEIIEVASRDEKIQKEIDLICNMWKEQERARREWLEKKEKTHNCCCGED